MAVYIRGTGQTQFGELWDKDLRTLAVEASMKAVESAKIDLSDIDAVYVGNMLASRFTGQDHLGALISTELGITCPSIHVEAACASGGVAIRQAFLDISSGNSKNILVVGVEKMTDVPVEYATTGLSGASDEEWEAFYGVTFPSLYAMIAREHMNKYGTSKESLARIAVKNHKHGSMNKYAQFQKEITLEAALNATMVSDPLNLMDCSPISDGAAAVVLSSKAKSGVKIIASSQAQDTLALHDRNDITILEATVKAGNDAFKTAGINRKDIGIMEVHDCFTIAELCAYEDLGFAKKGEGNKLIDNGDTYYNSKLPVNTSGGLKSAGHPVGATGIKQAIEMYLQLNGIAGDRQIKNEAKYGLTQNVGGSGATCVVTIYEKVKGKG
jgi:acetyl-CoA C-acetyltransferase